MIKDQGPRHHVITSSCYQVHRSPPFGNLWQLLSYFYIFWQLLPSFGNFRGFKHFLQSFGNFCHLLATIWKFLQLLVSFATFANYWHLLGKVSKTPVTEIFREGGGGVPPLSVNFFPLGFLEPAVREGGGGSTPPFR